jgi:hypothetical protein
LPTSIVDSSNKMSVKSTENSPSQTSLREELGRMVIGDLLGIATSCMVPQVTLVRSCRKRPVSAEQIPRPSFSGADGGEVG